MTLFRGTPAKRTLVVAESAVAVLGAQTRIDCKIAALRVIEASRLYAAANGGNLPDRLDMITQVPVPDDPFTGRPFAYSRDGQTATLTAHIPSNPKVVTGLRYRVTIRK